MPEPNNSGRAVGVLSRLAEIQRRWDPRFHRFNLLWGNDELGGRQIVRCLEQYRELAVATGERWQRTAAVAPGGIRERLARHAGEQSDVGERWARAIVLLGGDPSAAAEPATRMCARTWSGRNAASFPELVAGLYAIHGARYVTWEARTAGFRFAGRAGDEASEAFASIGEHENVAFHSLRELLAMESVFKDPRLVVAEAESVAASAWLVLNAALLASDADV